RGAAAPAPPPPLRYVSLGDSFSAGGGLAGGVHPCGRAPGAYPALVAQRGMLAGSFHACNGATTADVLDRERHPGEGPQIDNVASDADVVTVSIGGNDIGFGPVITDCVLGRQPCTRFDRQVTAELAALGPRLARLYAGVRERAPAADVLVLGYPRLVADPDLSGLETCAGLTADEARWVRQKGDELDRVVRAAAGVAGVRFVDAAAAFAGHEACTAEPWMEGISVATATSSFHPNAAGHDRLAALVLDALGR
ncbi:MAG TPA: SGNH/GDSL hydrolase family protein, partial [Acidimicrobiales bacterium]|nr:SGNH/GDSL hydrolase family protein [Acidimicrobiales bacterium]